VRAHAAQRESRCSAYCLLNRFDPQTDNDYSDIAAARELLKLRDQLNQPTAKETTRRMIETANAKNGGSSAARATLTAANFDACKKEDGLYGHLEG
jgi:hypothetical protein